MAAERLTSKSNDEEMPEALYTLMQNVEEALELAGARAKHDYTYRDLMEFAVQLYAAGE